MIDRINPPQLASWPSTSYAAGGQGAVYFLSGHVAQDADGDIIGEGDIEAQCERIWSNLCTTIEAIGATTADVAMMTIYLTDIGYRAAMNSERVKHFPEGFEPAGSTVVVSALAHPQYLAEVELVVIAPRNDDAKPITEASEGSRLNT